MQMERGTWRGRRHWWYLFALPLLGVAVGIALTPLAGFGLLLLAADVVLLVPALVMRWLAETYTVTPGPTGCVQVRRGVFTRQTDQIALQQVESIQVQQGLGGRLWRYGDVTVQGSGGHRLLLPMVARPDVLRRAVEGARARAAAPGAVPAD